MPKSILYNLGAASVSRFGSAILTFVLFWWLTYRLPTAEVGTFALAMSIFAVLQYLPLLGLHVQLVRDAATESTDFAQTINGYWWFALPVAVALGVAVAAYGRWAPVHESAFAFLYVGLAMLPTSWTVVAEAALLGRERMRGVAQVNLMEAAWRLAGSMAAIALGGTLAEIMLVFLAGRCLAAAAYLKQPDLHPPRWRSPPSRTEQARLWKYVPVYLTTVALTAASARFDILALPFLVSMHDVGVYSAGARLYDAALMVPTLAATVVLPPLARLFVGNRSEFVRLLPPSLQLVMGGGLLLAVAIAGAAPWLIGSMFPARFSQAAGIVQLLMFAAALASTDIVLSSTMLAAKDQASDMRCMAIGFFTLLCAVFVLVPSLGTTGAALAVTLQMLARVVSRMRWATRALGVSGLWASLARASMATGASVTALWLLGGQHWLVAVAAAVCTYVAIAFATGLFSRAGISRMLSTLATQRESKQQ